MLTIGREQRSQTPGDRAAQLPRLGLLSGPWKGPRAYPSWMNSSRAAHSETSWGKLLWRTTKERMGRRSSAPLQGEGRASRAWLHSRQCRGTVVPGAPAAQLLLGQGLPSEWQGWLQSSASHPDRTLQSSTHMAADVGWSRPPQYSSAHSQMMRKVRTEETERGGER